MRVLLVEDEPRIAEDVREALARAGRRDLIGTGPKALVPPAKGKGALPIHMKRARARVSKR